MEASRTTPAVSVSLARGCCPCPRIGQAGSLPSQLWADEQTAPAASTSPCSNLATHSCTHGCTPLSALHVLHCAALPRRCSHRQVLVHAATGQSVFSGVAMWELPKASCSARDEPVTRAKRWWLVQCSAVCRARGKKQQSSRAWQVGNGMVAS